MRKQIALFATVAALAVTPALAQTTMPKQDAQPAPQAQPAQPPASSQTTQAPATQALPAEKFVDMQTSGQWLASDIIGMKVVGSNNESIGSVSDLLVDDSGNILAAVVGVGGFLGIGQKSVAISFDTLNIASDKDGNAEARLTLTKEELESAPEFKTAEAARRDAQRQTTTPPAASPATKPATPRN